MRNEIKDYLGDKFQIDFAIEDLFPSKNFTERKNRRPKDFKLSYNLDSKSSDRSL